MLSSSAKKKKFKPPVLDSLISLPLDGIVYHPKVQPLRSPTQCREYVTKYGNFQEWRDFNSKSHSPGKRLFDVWKEIIQSSSDKPSFLNLVYEQRPQDLVLKSPSLHHFADNWFKPTMPPHEPKFTNFLRLPDPLSQWVNDNIL